MPDCLELPIFRDREQMISCWRLTRAEITEIERTGHVWLHVFGGSHPPVAISGIKPFEKPSGIMPEDDRDEIHRGADLLLGEGHGGVAIWCTLDELSPRGAVRFRATKEQGQIELGLAELTSIVAALQVSLSQIQANFARQLGMSHEDFGRACAVTMGAIGGRFETYTEQRDGGKGEEK